MLILLFLILNINLIINVNSNLLISYFKLNFTLDCTTVSSNKYKLWPVNNNFQEIILGNITGNDGEYANINITGVFQDEFVKDVFKYNCNLNNLENLFYNNILFRTNNRNCSDAIIKRNGNVRLRRKQIIPYRGRTYYIFFKATDNYNNYCKGLVKICVPYENKHNDCLDLGPLYNSLYC
jgi:hypothetical protein